MINYDSILSAFDGKPTLLQWLKMVKKALDESILKNVNITQNGQKVVFTFNFEDGTSISTPEVTLPKGDKGDTGTGIVSVTYDHTDIIGDNTETYFKVTLSNGVENTFAVFAKNGKNGSNGNDGVSITGINTVGNEVVGDETLTTLRANYSNDTHNEFVVKAKNGSSDATKIYTHSVKIQDSPNRILSFNVYSIKQSLNIDDVFEQIPETNYIPMCFLYETTKIGILSVKKGYDNSFGTYYITASGIGSYGQDIHVYNFRINKNQLSITDTLLGENL